MGIRRKTKGINFTGGPFCKSLRVRGSESGVDPLAPGNFAIFHKNYAFLRIFRLKVQH